MEYFVLQNLSLSQINVQPDHMYIKGLIDCSKYRDGNIHNQYRMLSISAVFRLPNLF